MAEVKIYFQDINVQLIEDIPKNDLQSILGKYIYYNLQTFQASGISVTDE